MDMSRVKLMYDNQAHGKHGFQMEYKCMKITEIK